MVGEYGPWIVFLSPRQVINVHTGVRCLQTQARELRNKAQTGNKDENGDRQVDKRTDSMPAHNTSSNQGAHMPEIFLKPGQRLKRYKMSKIKENETFYNPSTVILSFGA